MLDALGLACCARRVKHRGAFGFIGDRSRWLRADRILPRIVIRDRAVHHVALDAARNQIGRFHLARDVGHRMRGDKNFRAGVIYDVGDFLRRQARADRCVIESGPLRRPENLVIARMILGEQCDCVAGLESKRTQQIRGTIRLIVELAIGDDLAGRRPDVSGLVRIALGVNSGMHELSYNTNRCHREEEPICLHGSQTVDQGRIHAYTMSMTLDAKSLDTKSIEGICLGGCVRKLNRMVTSIYDGALADAGLKTSQFSVLVSVANRKQARPAELTKQLELDESTVSRNVERMCARGWLRLVQDGDRRSHLIEVTDKGRALIRKCPSSLAE